MQRGILKLVLVIAAVVGCQGAAGPRLVVEDDTRPVFLVQSFCFAPEGMMELDVKGIKIKGEEPTEESKAGLVVMKADGGYSSNAAEYAAAEGDCLLDSKLHRTVKFDATNVVYSHEFPVNEEGHYYILFVNCRGNTPISFDMTLNLKNPGGVFLPAGDLPLPTAFACIAVVFLLCALLWSWQIKSNWVSVHKIHLLMLLLVFTKTIQIVLEALRFRSLKYYDDGFGWTTAYYIFTFLKGGLFFTAILLIGTGLFIMKPFLSERDKKILWIVLPLQVLVNVAMVVVEETPPGTIGWLTWRDLLHFLDIICCCAILFPIVWSIRHLREGAQTDGRAQRNLEKLKLFREFYIMVVCYIYFTRIIVYLVRATLPCKYTWISTITSEFATAAFFVATGYKFRPRESNPYLEVHDEEGEGAEMLEQGSAPAAR